ncbi:MAG: hypothetical protein LQ342_007701 [Letrouitia transgressa]|nr:MAG: hypothetical protein LQ342_007701 [Letrouitia transgressa]
MRPGSQEPSRGTSNSPPPHRRSCSDIPKISPTASQSYPWHSDTQERATQGSSPFSPPAEYSSDPLSPLATDRVFPIRSVISVDPNSTPAARTDHTGDGFPGMSLESSGTAQFIAGPRSQSRQSRQPSASGTTSVDDTASDISNTDSNPITLTETPLSTSAPRRRSITLGGRARSSPGPPSTGKERMGGARQMSTFLDTHSIRSESQASGPRSVADSAKSLPDETGALVTARFKHVVTEEGHAVIIGRDGDTLQRCEDEPIHIPGAVQSFGLLIAIKEDDEGKFKVRVVSENAKKIIGYSPKQLFALDSFCDIFSDEQADNLLDHVDFIRDDDADPATNGPEVFTLAIRSPASRKLQKLWCAMHLSPGNGDVIICEFELEDDQVNPLVPTDNATPEPPEDTLHGNPTEAEFAESTVNLSKPLRVLRSARKRKGEAAAMEVFNIMSQVQEQLANAPNLEVFLKVLVGVVKEVTGFHRVMIYQFDQAFNGKVVTELVDPRATKDLYKGLNFPASDIPKQARDLYKVNKVRLLYDRDQETSRLVCKTTEDLETPLDLTFAYLRAMSPIHIKYLANMAVRASMSISINAFNELWGLIACHSYGSKGMRVSFPIRKMCRLMGDSASRNIERLSYASRLHARKLINTVPTETNPSGYIIASSDDLLKLFDADYGLLSIREETKILGKLDSTQEALAMLEYLRFRKLTSVTNSVDIQLDFPDLRYPPGFHHIAGLLLVPLSVGGSDFIVFFRKGQTREVKWAGNPYEKYIREGTEGYLEPRKSFQTWSEMVIGKSREWTEEQIETAAVLCLVYGKFIEVWRQKEAALQNSQLTRLLLANSAHEVRTPLNAIINYLEIALEGAIDQETRENLSKSHSASKSLIYVINDLLDLTKAEEGNELIKDEIFDLPATVREATDMFKGDAKRKQIEYEVSHNEGVPQYVVGDQRRIRQAVSNVTANAIQHTSSGSVKVELWLVGRSQDSVDIDIVVQDTGVGMSSAKLDALFAELEQVQTESDEGLQEKLAPQSKEITAGDDQKRTLGLGLALVARIVRNMNGQLRLKSEEGRGSRFVMQINFALPPNEEGHGMLENSATIAPPSNQPTTPPVDEGEVLLVNKSAQKAAPPMPSPMVHRNSSESVNSFRSAHSVKSINSVKSATSAKSDVDRMIEAIQEPAMKPKAQTIDGSQSKSTSSRRSSALSRPQSAGAVISDTQMQTESGPGEAAILDSRTPIRPIRMPGDTSTGSPIGHGPRTPSRVLFDFPDKRPEPPRPDHLNVLVAEDDPVNSKIIKKRLEKSGHVVHLTVNGEECSSHYGERPVGFDVVLMDMQVSCFVMKCHALLVLTALQMPIVDGLTSTKMIRSFEKANPHTTLSNPAARNGRVPIFAVSASLVEKERQKYIDAGFDGWILKPIDFQRLSVLLAGIVEERTRERCLYVPGQWEKGGWFSKTQADVFDVSTAPAPNDPVSQTQIGTASAEKGHESTKQPISREQEQLNNLDTDAVHADSRPEDPGQSGRLAEAVVEGGADMPRGGTL